jgi:hypothetical protein
MKSRRLRWDGHKIGEKKDGIEILMENLHVTRSVEVEMAGGWNWLRIVSNGGLLILALLTLRFLLLVV